MDYSNNRINYNIGRRRPLGYAVKHNGREGIAYKGEDRLESFIYLDDINQMFEDIEVPEIIDIAIEQ